MGKIKSRNTTPELGLRRSLFRAGMRFRIEYGKEKIDIAFPRRRVAIFVDGCFWHSCKLHGTLPRSNTDYWKRKFSENEKRAIAKDLRLKECGWVVVHFWEHEIKENPEHCVSKITELLVDKQTFVSNVSTARFFYSKPHW